MEKKLEVMFVNQYHDIEEKFMALIGCGFTCFFMIATYWGATTGNLTQEISLAYPEGYLKGKGWLHNFLLGYLKKFGIEYQRKENFSFLEIKKSLDDGFPVPLSFNRVMCNKIISTHIMLCVGYKESPDRYLEGFYFHDPATLEREDGMFVYYDIQDFLAGWRKVGFLYKD